MKQARLLSLLIIVVFLAGCAKNYTYKPIPIKDVSAYPNSSSILGARIGAEAFYDDAKVKEIFGFNIKSAGVVPVQVVVDNVGKNNLGLASNARVMDADGNWWEMLPENIVYDRVGQYVGGIDGGAVAKKSLVYGVAGAVIGAAVGVVAGENVGEALGKGAAIGAAAGAASEIVLGDEDKASGNVRRDFAGRAFNNQVVPAGTTTHGFLYFPAEMKQPRTLRLYMHQGTPVKAKDEYGYDKVPEVKWSGETTMVEFQL